MNNVEDTGLIDLKAKVNSLIERIKGDYTKFKRYSDRWTEQLKGFTEQLKDQCLPEIKKNYIQDGITEAHAKLEWAKESMEKLQDDLNYYEQKIKQLDGSSIHSVSPLKLATINTFTKGKQGKTGKPGGLGPIVKSKKCP